MNTIFFSVLAIFSLFVFMNLGKIKASKSRLIEMIELIDSDLEKPEAVKKKLTLQLLRERLR